MADRTNGLNNIDIGSGRRGFRNRNLGLGQAGTVVDAEWANGLQEEIVRIIELLGLTPSAVNREQLIQALRRLAGGNVTSFSANAALTPDHAGVIMVSAGSANVTLTLPAVNAAGGFPLRFDIVRTDSSANTLTVQRAGSDTINGLTTALTLPAGASARLLGDGSAAWRISDARGLVDLRSLTTAGTTAQVVPIWATRVGIEVWGAGGGGGGCSAAGGARGGGGGEYRRGLFSVTPGGSLSCTVGAGGASGNSSPTSGGNGGTTSVGSLISAVGGSGGSASGGGGATGGGGGGTGGSGGVYAQKGADSQLSFVIGGNYTISPGGPSLGHGYGIFVLATAGTNGNDGYGPGCGGNGAAGGVGTGGLGNNGRILLDFLP